GPVEDRVNIWPAFYYREPALSVLWPLFEMTDDYVAVRPLFSVYGLDQTNHQYNVLWPLAQFDRRTDDSWTFPVFWSDSHFVLFPLYWHYGQPWGSEGGADSLFPLWILSRKENERSDLWSPWPLVYFWSDRKDNTDGSMILPLYWYRSDDHASEFYSPLWLARQKENGDFWQCLPPLYFQAANGNNSSFITPLWAQGRSEAVEWKAMFPLWFFRQDGFGGFDLFAPLPLVRLWSDGSGSDRGSMVLPFYCQSREGAASRFLSLPWSSVTDQNGFWRLLLPLYFQSSNAVGSTLITLLWAQGRSGENNWQASGPFWVRSQQDTNRSSLYCPWPLAHFWSDRGGEDHGSSVIPLYWHQRRNGESQFLSWLWFSHANPDGDSRRLLPPLFYQESTKNSSTLITPLWAQGYSETNDWRVVIPLCYWDRRQHVLLSPLWARWRSGESETWLAPWSLSWNTRSPERDDLTLLGGFARASWGEKPGPGYVFPLFYRDPADGTLLSPLWLQWRNEDTQISLVPELLSWKTQNPERSDLWMAGGLARASWGAKPGPDYVLPLYYHDSSRLLTPLFGRDDRADFLYLATPLAGVRTDDHAGSWFFPLYIHSRDKATGAVNDNYLLLGGYQREQRESRSWFIPLFYYRDLLPPVSDLETNNHARAFGKSFWCLPICWYRNDSYIRTATKSVTKTNESAAPPDFALNQPPALTTTWTNAPSVRDYTVSHGAFPLWNYASRSTPAEEISRCNTSILLWLYDYKHEVNPLPGVRPVATNDYTRARVLWRLWHYERLNGNVSVDVFPSFTYDHKTDGFKKISFLWRGFRYECAPDGKRKLDVLFVPLKRWGKTRRQRLSQQHGRFARGGEFSVVIKMFVRCAFYDKTVEILKALIKQDQYMA
ncbi:MAG: hypothetical protein ACLQQ0_17775, partial [Limisphaerales bacterium]